MAVFKCKICGADIDFKPGTTVCECAYCGTKQTLQSAYDGLPAGWFIGEKANTTSLLRRAFMYLEDKNWDDADIYCEKVLDIDPENAHAYLGKLMAELKVSNEEELSQCPETFEHLNSYKKTIRFADETLIRMLSDCSLQVRYNRAVRFMKRAKNEPAYKSTAKAFSEIADYKDAASLAEQCLVKAEECRKDKIYFRAKEKMLGNGAKTPPMMLDSLNIAMRTFREIPGWRDADELEAKCQRKIDEIEKREEKLAQIAAKEAEERRIAAEKARKKKTLLITVFGLAICAVIAFLIVLTTVILPPQKYNAAMKLYDAGYYQAAYAEFEKLSYLDSEEKAVESLYLSGVELYDAGSYSEAYAAFRKISYKDSADKAAECLCIIQIQNLSGIKPGDTVKFGCYEQDYNKTNGPEEIEWMVLSVENQQALVLSQYALDCKPFHNTKEATTWEECSLREWLNNDFLNTAFSDMLKERIPTVLVTPDDEMRYQTEPANPTHDKIFLLGITELQTYFPSSKERHCFATAYARKQGAKEEKDFYKWWLRTMSSFRDNANVVDRSELIFSKPVNQTGIAVRPAMWITLE